MVQRRNLSTVHLLVSLQDKLKSIILSYDRTYNVISLLIVALEIMVIFIIYIVYISYLVCVPLRYCLKFFGETHMIILALALSNVETTSFRVGYTFSDGAYN